MGQERILVTGATGFIGKVLITKLVLHQEYNILALGRKFEDNFIKENNKYSNLKIANAEDWKVIREFDPGIIIHLAALNTSNDDSESISNLINSNVTYGVKLLNAIEENKNLKFFIYPRSFSEFRDGSKKPNYAYLYSASKAAFEPFLRYYSDKISFKYINAFFYSVYGSDPSVKRLMDFIVESISSNIPVDMTPGHQRLDFIHVEDITNFILSCIGQYSKFNNGETFEVGYGKNYSIIEVSEMVEKITNKKCNINWGGRPYRKRDVMNAIADISHTTEKTGWVPEISLEKGLMDFILNSL